MEHILITGASGQIGSDLADALRRQHPEARIICTDLAPPVEKQDTFYYETLDVCNGQALHHLIQQHEVDTVFHLASLLSAAGEKTPDRTWEVNMQGLKHVLDAARTFELRVFWPSSIAVFGPATPSDRVPQHATLDPSTMYGVTKVSGELLCRYYHARFGVDVRSLRYPGLISYKVRPGGGTTDYAVEIFYAAVQDQPYACFVRPDTRLPMMYMPDAIKAALDLMAAPTEQIRVRTSYNITAMSFSARELVHLIQERVPGFTCRFEPDDRQAIADSWPSVIDDSQAHKDWNWQPEYDLPAMADDMLKKLRTRLPFDKESTTA